MLYNIHKRSADWIKTKQKVKTEIVSVLGVPPPPNPENNYKTA